MNKTELAAALAHRMHLGTDSYSEETARMILGFLFAEDGIIAEELAAGRDVTVTGFGTFGVRHHDAYVMNNPRGGEPIDVPSGRAPTFHAGAALRRRVMRDVIQVWPVHR